MRIGREVILGLGLTVSSLVVADPGYKKPVSALTEDPLDWFENHTQIVYPVIAVVTLSLIALGIFSAWRTDDLSGVQKAEIKRDIIRELRREIHGLTAEQLTRATGVPIFQLVKLLEAMQDDKVLESRTDTRRITTWRLRGI